MNLITSKYSVGIQTRHLFAIIAKNRTVYDCTRKSGLVWFFLNSVFTAKFLAPFNELRKTQVNNILQCSALTQLKKKQWKQMWKQWKHRGICLHCIYQKFGQIFSLRASQSISLKVVVLVLVVVVLVVILCKNVSIRINKYLYSRWCIW